MSQNGPGANFTMFIGDHLSITSAKRWVGRVRIVYFDKISRFEYLNQMKENEGSEITP